jgi:hypothetical protein
MTICSFEQQKKNNTRFVKHKTQMKNKSTQIDEPEKSHHNIGLSFVNEQTGNQERIVEKIRTPAE